MELLKALVGMVAILAGLLCIWTVIAFVGLGLFGLLLTGLRAL